MDHLVITLRRTPGPSPGSPPVVATLGAARPGTPVLWRSVSWSHRSFVLSTAATRPHAPKETKAPQVASVAFADARRPVAAAPYALIHRSRFPAIGDEVSWRCAILVPNAALALS